MAGRLRDFFNSFVNAPARRPSGPAAKGRLRTTLERWIAGAPSSDPLYLTNRTFFQKARMWLLLGIPCAVIGLVVASGYLNREQTPSAAVNPNAVEGPPVALPNLDAVKLDSVKNVELTEINVVRGGASPVLTGKVRNKTGEVIRSVDCSFYLTDVNGSQLGSISVHLADLPANGTSEFQRPLQQKLAVAAIVRDLHTQ
jgi:hypothetical protein